jgi:hypothetical protein
LGGDTGVARLARSPSSHIAGKDRIFCPETLALHAGER